MFAASLSTLKKRANEFLKDEKAKREPEADVFGGLTTSAGVRAVRYEVQNDGEADREQAVFMLPQGGRGADGNVTAGLIRVNFPLPGRFHFRFKAHSQDGAFGGFIWVDLAHDAEAVPLYRGNVWAKALRLPDEAGVRVRESLPGGIHTTFKQPAQPAPVPTGTGAVYAAPAVPEPPLVEAAAPQPSAPAPPPSPPPPPAPPSDLMEMDLGGGLPMPGPSPGASPRASQGTAPLPTPVQMPDRQTLVAEREAKERARIEEAQRHHMHRRNTEDALKTDKVEANWKLQQELDKWAKTPDGQAFKDVRTLLSTMHSVIWEGSGWTQLQLSELMAKEGNVKKYYYKAIIMCHPDRQQEAPAEQQVRADRIFQALNEAFKVSRADG